MAVYTVGIWITKPGREDDFARRWREMAEWTEQEMTSAASGTLLRDREQPNRFVSFGPWASLNDIEAWRANPGFIVRVGAIRELLEEFSPMTLDDVTAG
jgi:heme-degrading monooxygenase HmoA